MKKNEMKVKVYMDFVNFAGEVYESCLIAEFRNMNWAGEFIGTAKTHETDTAKIRVENCEE